MERHDQPTTVQAYIQRMAEARAEEVFLYSPETKREMTFAELHLQARQITRQLMSLGLSKGDKVSFLLDNGLFTAGLFLGAMYGGFVPVPLNVRAGRSHLAYTLSHCDARVVFVSDDYASLMKEIRPEVGRTLEVIGTDVDQGPCWETAGTKEAAFPEVGPEDEALLIYTSGSTGMPKGALFSHRQVIAGARNSIIAHDLSDRDRSMCVLPLYHINGENVTLLPTLLTGGSVVLPHRFLVRSFWEWLTDYRCTWSALVPTIISQLLDWIDPRAAGMEEALERIRFIRSSSAPLAPSLHRAFEAKFKLPLLEAMGSTECCGNIFSNPLPPGKDKIGTPGLPFGFEAKIVGPNGAEVPPGEPGQILLRGPSITQGYYKNPEETAAVLGPDGWLKTGDLGRVDEDGYFFILGRSKELIIKGGMNIAPRQIDEALEAHPAVQEAAALGVPDHYLGEDIIAFAVPRPDARLTEGELLDFCGQRVGSFKSPSRIFIVNELPKGPSGKVQRLRLPELFQNLIQLSRVPAGANCPALAIHSNEPVTENEVPTTPIEEMIAETWAEVLETDQVGAHANFFGLGGHSLLAIEILSRLRKQFAAELSLNDFFLKPTVAQQAVLVSEQVYRSGRGDQAAGVGIAHTAPPAPSAGRAALEDFLRQKRNAVAAEEKIPRRDHSLPCPLSPAQERVWFLGQLSPGLAAFNEGDAARLRGPLDVPRLQEALNIIVTRHESLRTLIQVVDDRPVQVVLESWSVPFELIDLSGRAPAEREAEVKRLLIDDVRRPFNLAAEPALRATLVRLGPEEHVFILTLHHIICDGWSLAIFYYELARIYQALLRGKPHDLVPPPVQYGDFAVWKRQKLEAGVYAKDLAFWQEYLRSAPAALELPIKGPRPDVFSHRGAKRFYPLPRAATESLRRFSQREEISLFMVLTAAFNALLGRYTSQDDIVVGIPIANRDRPEMVSLFGFLIAFQALRTDLSGNPTFRELLGRVRKGMLDVNASRGIPFQKVVEALNPERDLSRAQVFQVMVIWKDRQVQMQLMDLKGLTLSHEPAHSGAAKYDLTVWFTDVGQDIWLELEYCTDLFDADAIDRLAGHFQTLLAGVIDNPDTRLASLPLLSPAEHRQILEEWNDTEVDYPRHACLHELFEAQVERTPDRVALVCGGRQCTYRELNRQADRLAQHLQGLGVGPDVLVALYLERSPEMVVALLGVLKAGGAYLPLDPVYPPERLAFMLEDAQPRVLVTQAGMQASLPPLSIPVVLVDGHTAHSATGPSNGSVDNSRQGPHRRPQSSASLAYVLYTSGSTGRPKGVQIPHSAVVNVLTALRKQIGVDAEDVWLAVTTLAFDIAALEILLPLTTGSRVVLAGQEVATDGLRLAELLAESGATVMQATPATWRMLVQAGWPGKRGLKTLCGGEALPPELASALCERGSILWNLYGPAETTIWSMSWHVRPGEPIVIGRPLANTQLYLLDENLQPVPVGSAGELYIGGEGLARGYLNRPELTAGRFIANPFRADAGARLYRTGDVARYRPDGCVEFLGRRDHQVKIRGFRIECGEIEAVLGQHPQVREAVVVARVGGFGERFLAAYVVSRTELAPEAATLREFLGHKLPQYMIPSTFVVVDAMPLTVNGKVDRRALPAPERGRPEGNRGAAPRTPGEAKVATIWAELLGVARVDLDDDFFDLGGHSLLAIRLLARIEKELGKRLPLTVLFKARTVRQLAGLLEGPLDVEIRRPFAVIQTARVGRPLFLLHSLSGELLTWRPLIQGLGPKQTVYGLKLPENDGIPEPFADLKDMAAHHVRQMCALQPEGPYCVAGYSFGATLALEIAQHLRAQGREVALLAVIDSGPFRRGSAKKSINARTLLAFGANLLNWLRDDLLKTSLRDTVARVRRKLQALVQSGGTGLTSLESRFSMSHLRDIVDPDNLPERYRRVIETNYQVWSRYEPRPYPGRVTLFRARTRPLFHSFEADLGWSRVAQGGVEVHNLPGHHWSIMQPPIVETLARRLGTCLERVG
jgi:amino acid adenylation domain-containing protein